jgi:hypothetical protein
MKESHIKTRPDDLAELISGQLALFGLRLFQFCNSLANTTFYHQLRRPARPRSCRLLRIACKPQMRFCRMPRPERITRGEGLRALACDKCCPIPFGCKRDSRDELSPVGVKAGIVEGNAVPVDRTTRMLCSARREKRIDLGELHPGSTRR